MARKQTTLQLVYIHGFRGDHTTFQAFPTDLHEWLLPRVAPHIHLQSCVYPTYKSVRPIGVATQNFLAWLGTQPAGPVILLGHSMGGLLAAEAATASSLQRVVGMVAFDTPFLGMHPHVVISGIASLFPKDAGHPPKTEGELNNPAHVDMVDEKAVDDWEAYKATLKVPSARGSQVSVNYAPSSAGSRSPASLPPRSTSPSISGTFLDKATTLVAKHANEPVVRWFRKHSEAPFSAMTRWVVEHFEFGACMFDPSGLRERYQALEKWEGRWVNYFSRTVAERGDALGGGEGDDAETSALTVEVAAGRGGEGLQDANAERDAIGREKKKKKKGRPARHFIVLPFSSSCVGLGCGEKWEKVTIAGVEDEVGAHCGLFIRGQNLEYDGFVERVGVLVLGWSCELLD